MLQPSSVASSPKKFANQGLVYLSEINSAEDLHELSAKQMKDMLAMNRVNFKGVVEKQELLKIVERVWRQHIRSTEGKHTYYLFLLLMVAQYLYICVRTRQTLTWVQFQLRLYTFSTHRKRQARRWRFVQNLYGQSCGLRDARVRTRVHVHWLRKTGIYCRENFCWNILYNTIIPHSSIGRKRCWSRNNITTYNRVGIYLLFFHPADFGGQVFIKDTNSHLKEIPLLRETRTNISLVTHGCTNQGRYSLKKSGASFRFSEVLKPSGEEERYSPILSISLHPLHPCRIYTHVE